MAKFERRIEIKAPATTVWSILSNIRDWPQWFPDMNTISGVTAVAPGGNFDFTHGTKKGTGSILRADSNDLLIVVTKTGDHPVTHSFDLTKERGFLGMGGSANTILEYIREWDPPGGFIGNWVVGSNPFDLTEMDHTLDKIRDMAERHGGVELKK